MGRTSFTDQVTLARIEPGMWVYTTPEPDGPVNDSPGRVSCENPDYEPGVARRVRVNVKKGSERYLIFEDKTFTPDRSGSALCYRFHLGKDAKPVPVPVYPVCPQCQAKSTDPACHTSSGSMTSWHAKRAKAAAADPAPKLSSTTPTPTSMHVTDDTAVAQGSDDALCGQCKGYGVVRKYGKNAGHEYKTVNGADQATANGNSEVCPLCTGKGETAAA